MARRGPKRALVFGALILGATPMLVGCTVDGPPALGPATTAPTAPSAPTESTEPSVETCDDLVSDADESRYAAAGWQQIDDYADRQAAENTPNVAFLDYGGALCLWGVPNSDAADALGGSPIDAAQEELQRARLDAEGYTFDEHNAADRYVLAHESGFDSYYLFVGGFWFYANSEAGVDHIRQNADVG